MYEVFQTPARLRQYIRVLYCRQTAEWSITGKGTVPYNDVAAWTTYGTDQTSAYKILEDSLNLRDVRVYRTVKDPNGQERRVLDSKETTLASQKQQAVRSAFRDWLWRDPDVYKRQNQDRMESEPCVINRLRHRWDQCQRQICAHS